MSLGCCRRWGHRDERRGSSASDVGTDDGIATTTTPPPTTTATTSTTTTTITTATNYKQATADLSGDEPVRVVPRKAVMWHYHTAFLVESGW